MSTLFITFLETLWFYRFGNVKILLTKLSQVVGMSTLGDRIKKLRDRENIQQNDFAKKIGVSNVVLSRYESGERKPDYDTLDKIADYFQVSTDYLLGRTDSPNYEQNDNDQLKYYIDKINKEFPDSDLMFKDMESLTAEDLKEVYEYIKFKKSQK